MMTIAAAIARSIANNEIVHVDLSDQLALLRREASEAGDLEECQTIDALLSDGSDDSEVDPGLSTRKQLSRLLAVLASNAEGLEDDVEGDDVHEMWGTTEDGGQWRVRINIDVTPRA